MVLTQGGARGLEVRSRGVEFAAADLDLGAHGEQPVPEARGSAAQRDGAEPFGLVPVADREQRLDLVREEQGAVYPVPAHHFEPCLPHSRRLPGPSQLRQHVAEIDVRAFQAKVITNLLGQLQGLAKMGDTLLAPAEAGEIASEHG
jgi:hypothetical protein